MDRITVLIADDSIAARDGLQSIVAAHADIVVIGTAINGTEALEKVKALSPHVVLMDAQMPGMNGIEAIRRIKQESSNSRILFLTVHPVYLQHGIKAGADAALLKDVPRQELIATVRRLAAM